MHFITAATAAAVLLLGGLALYLRNDAPPESAQVGATGSPEGLLVPPLKERVAKSQVIVVATGLDSSPAPPSPIPGDLPEVLVRFQVKRILKGKLADKVITTIPGAAARHFIGKEWIVFLTPDYLAGKHQYVGCLAIEFEPIVKSYLPQENK